MPNEAQKPNELDLKEPLPPQAQGFTSTLKKMLDGRPKDEATVAGHFEGLEGVFDLIAAGLYSQASMLVGEGEDSVRLVETAVANADMSVCSEPEEARQAGRRALAAEALKLIAAREPEGLAAPVGLEHAETCIEDDDLDAAGVSSEELERMMAGPDRDRMRAWLESLPTPMRSIFVLRAVAGFSTVQTAALLAEFGGPGAAGWRSEPVRELFRQGLCSLASQMVKAGIRE
jgi:hypothetical protein